MARKILVSHRGALSYILIAFHFSHNFLCSLEFIIAPSPLCLFSMYLSLNRCPFSEAAPRSSYGTIWAAALLPAAQLSSVLPTFSLPLPTSVFLFYFGGYFFNFLFQLSYQLSNFYCHSLFSQSALCFLTFSF